MADRCLLYYITDRRAFPGSEFARRDRLLEKIAEAARCGVDYIQLREKDLSTRHLESLAREAVRVVREGASLRTDSQAMRTALLINSRTDVALAVGADGVQLRADDIYPADVREMWKSGTHGFSTGHELPLVRDPFIGVSCHSSTEVNQAASNQASFAVFGPVFEKKDAPGISGAGLSSLRSACQASIPVIALGGITLENARACVEAGAAGIAAIRLFQENDIAKVVNNLRA